ncbi:hypothetical protein EV361DRAFT_984597 [Lentinula raphanica]|nr:hypothetical protein EV361DRAFT_984597 [Lentinula raphanica]
MPMAVAFQALFQGGQVPTLLQLNFLPQLTSTITLSTDRKVTTVISQFAGHTYIALTLSSIPAYYSPTLCVYIAIHAAQTFRPASVIFFASSPFPPMQKVAPPAGNTPIDDALRLHIYSTETERVPCLEFKVLSPTVYYCSSHGLSKLVHEESIELGQSRKTITDELSRTLTGSTSGASWRDMDDSMDNLANSHIFVDTPGTMGIWEQVIVRETFTDANKKKSIELLLLIGHTGLKFTAPESTMPVHVKPQIMMLFSHHVNFRNPAAVNKAIQYISGLTITDVPYWLKEVLINEGLDKMPNCGLPWNQIDKAIGILPEIESGFIYHRVEVTTTASLADLRARVFTSPGRVIPVT